METSVFSIYHLKPNQNPINLEVNIGKGQEALTRVLLNGKSLKKKQGSFSIQIDSDKGLHNSRLKVVSYCEDINPDTNELLVTLQLTGGLIPRHWTLSKVVKPEHFYVFEAEFYLRQ